eukprot:Stramenopile-MAST_4_protein_3112
MAKNVPGKHLARSSFLWPAEQYRARQQTEGSTRDKPIGIVNSEEIARELHKGYVEDAQPLKRMRNNKILVNERKREGPKRGTSEIDPGIVDVSNDGADVVDLTATDHAGADVAVQPTCIGRKQPVRCKKCGATDHKRSTKNMCPMYEPRMQHAAPAVAANVNDRGYAKALSLPDSLRMEEFTQLASESALFEKEHHPLDPYQEEALQMVMQGKNVFITGAAGTGKSTLLRRIQEELFTADKEFHVMAPTGIAAVNVGGCTINSFVGIGVPKTVHDFQKMWKKKKQLRSSDVWIIDEVSMLSGEILDFIESMMREIRGSSEPFGGVQLILCGDFLQLPPVGNTPHPAEYKNALQATDLFLNRGYAFQATCWPKSQIHTARLQQVHRQGGDRHMVEALQEMRLGTTHGGMARQFLRDCCRPLQVNTDGIKPTILHCKNVDVDKINNEELEHLAGDKRGLVKCLANDTTKPAQNAPLQRLDLQLLEKYFGQCRALDVLSLKVGAQVMLLKNLSPSLVNGSRGVVAGFETWKKVYSRLNKEHKENNSKSLLRPTKGGGPDSLYGGEHVLEMIKRVRGLKTKQGAYVYPIVQFQNGEKVTVTPETFSSQIHGIGESTRIQIPLTLAWAITVHKSQGMSIDHLVVSLGDVFTEGQAYVALSRATSKAGLEIRNFNPQCVFASKKCLAFEKGETTPSWLEEAQGTWDATRARVLEDLKEQASRVYPMCKCDQEASRMQVRKAGPNQDRFFFSCSKNYKHKDRCGFFQWDR